MPGVKSGSGPETELFIVTTVAAWLQCWAIPRAVRAPVGSVFQAPLGTPALVSDTRLSTPTVRCGSAVIFTSLNVDRARSFFPSTSRAVHQLSGCLSDFSV